MAAGVGMGGRDGTAKIMPIEPAHREGVLEFDRRLGTPMRRSR